MTATATIQVAYVNPPEEGKNKGSIKTAAGEYFGVWANQLGLFRAGADYEITFKERVWNGKTYRDVVKCHPHTPPQAVPPPTGAHGIGGVSAQPPQGIAVSDHTNSPDPGESYFITHILAAKIAACHIGRDADLGAEIRKLRGDYRNGARA